MVRYDRLHKDAIESYDYENSLAYKLNRTYQLPESIAIDVLSICNIQFDIKTELNYRSEFAQIEIRDNCNKFDEL